MKIFENNNKILLYILLIPFYFNVFITIVVTPESMISVPMAVLFVGGPFFAAWALSHKKKYIFNILGLAYYLVEGYEYFSRLFIESKRTGYLWIYEVWYGGLLIFLGVLGLVVMVTRKVMSRRKM